LRMRLQQRPAWRQTHDIEFLSGQVQFNRWFKNQGAQPNPVIEIIDTTGIPLAETLEQVKTWIRTWIAA
jgi:hypothetical protein